MFESFTGVLSPLLMLFTCIIVGYALNKFKILPENSATVLSKCETYVFLPALGYFIFSKYCTVKTITENSDLILYSTIATALAYAMAVPLSNMFVKNDVNKRNIYRYALVFANHGFMGNAVVPLVLGGDEALYKYLLFALPVNFLTNAWGICVLTPKEYRGKNILKNVFNAPMIGMLLGIVMGLSGAQKYVPDFVVTTVNTLQGCMGPVAMILTGFVIGGYCFKELISNKKVYIATALRLIILPAIIISVLILCGADRNVLVLALFAFATPLGLNTVVIPASYNGDTKTGAAMATVSHTLCVLTIPLMYGLLKLY